jgi:hypothetical protein
MFTSQQNQQKKYHLGIEKSLLTPYSINGVPSDFKNEKSLIQNDSRVIN